MTYKALYRKYRPKNFDDVAGQQIVVQILKNSIVNNKISHAYLFYGPRGTGKTSIAKIFARTVNCENSKNGIPCGKCVGCIANDDNNAVDIIEIDAASNNGVDEIRELKSKINLVPSVMKYKVYIIDEVHMLSLGAFNALLKTLEEPPNHVIFILATTELHKVPNTIISRCQLMEFRKISDYDMFSSLKSVADSEKIKIDDDAIMEIIKYSDGGMRDALGLLDKLSLYSNDSIDVSKVRTICGNASIEDISVLLDCIKKCDPTGIVEKIDELYLDGADLINVTNDVILLLKDDLLKYSNSNISSILLKLVDTVEKMKKSSNQKVLLEASILSVIVDDTNKNISREIFFEDNNENNDIENSVDLLTNGVVVDKNKEDSIDKINFEKFKLIRVNNTFVHADKILLQKIRNKWKELQNFIFDSNYGRIASALVDSIPVVCSDDYIVLMVKYDSLSSKLNSKYLDVEGLIFKMFDHNYKVVSLSKSEWEERKNEYINCLREKKHYTLMPEDFLIAEEILDGNVVPESKDDLTVKGEELFGSEIVEIK